MSEIKFILLKLVDGIIRFMAIIGGFFVALIGMIMGWWNNDVGVLIYVLFFGFGLLYCNKYNGREWTI